MRPSLSEFIEIGRTKGRANMYLDVPSFNEFYARFGPRYLGGEVYTSCLDLARVEVEEKLRNTGIFTNLVKTLLTDYPLISLYVECVLNPSFKKLLLKLGFKPHEWNPDCFYIIGENTK